MSFRYLLLVLAISLFAVAAGAQMTNDECLGCHNDPTATTDTGGGKTRSVHVDPAKFAGSIHGSFGCTDCHSNISSYPHEPKPKAVDCSSCHTDAVNQWKNSRHAKAFTAGNRQAAGCLSCHGGNAHAILPQSDPLSTTTHANVPKTCGTCHGQKLVMETGGFSTQPSFSYNESVHGKAVAAGNQKAAVCTDCHNAHEVRGANDQKSTIFKFNIPQTCGKCHDGVTKVFATSVHGQAIKRGSSMAPVCTDCHGIHNIKSHIDPNSSVAAQNISRTACGQCHGSVRLSREIGATISRVQTYEDSYHGLAMRLGMAEAAHCASCHGVHNIYSENDPRSMVHKGNVSKTCGTCHPGAGEKFAHGKIHTASTLTVPGQFGGAGTIMGDTIIKWVSLIYIPLTVLTIGGMALHNINIWVHKARMKRRDPRRRIVRMNRTQRIQHILLVTSFFALVVTGFALAWPNSWFTLISGPESVRNVIHRVAAVVMILLGLYHLAYMVFTKEGREGLKAFWFSFKDASDVVGVMKFHLGFSKEHPTMGRFTYAEKAEYWALVWGTIVMGVTGLMLWFEVQVTTWFGLPRWSTDVAVMVHFYEAILATLAIIVWHLYAVIFDPDVYPISWAWYDGKVTDSNYIHEHGADYQRIKAEQGLKSDAGPEAPEHHH